MSLVNFNMTTTLIHSISLNEFGYVEINCPSGWIVLPDVAWRQHADTRAWIKQLLPDGTLAELTDDSVQEIDEKWSPKGTPHPNDRTQLVKVQRALTQLLQPSRPAPMLNHRQLFEDLIGHLRQDRLYVRLRRGLFIITLLRIIAFHAYDAVNADRLYRLALSDIGVDTDVSVPSRLQADGWLDNERVRYHKQPTTHISVRRGQQWFKDADLIVVNDAPLPPPAVPAASL
jgi:hypothetical protein